MATRPASKLNLQEFGIQDEIELVDKKGRTDLTSLTQRVDDITPPDNIDISEDGVKVYANYDVNELGWGCENKTYYFDTAAEFSLGDRTYTKTNAKPAFGGVIGTPGDGQNHAIVLVSTEADSTYFSWNNTAYSFDYNGTTWYYCGGTYAYWGSPATGISVIPDKTLSLEDAARYMLDSAQVYVDDGKFSEIAEPNSGYLFAGGGSQDDYSDATFKVSKEGVVTAQDVEINGESITDKIDNIIDDTATDTDTTWSSNKITEEIEDKASVTKTASGNPIEITDGADAPLVKCVTAIQGNQDLHGYDKPWVGGSGKNKLPMTVDGIKAINTGGTWSGNVYTRNGVTFTLETDGDDNVTGIKVNGTANAVTYFLVANITSLGTFDGTYVVNGGINGGSETTFALQVYSDVTDIFINAYNANDWRLISETTPTANISSAYITIRNGYTANNLLFKPMIRLSTESDPTFTPYSNICPISGYTEGEIEVRGKNLCDKNDFNHTGTLTYKPMFVGEGTFTMSTNCPPTGGGQENYRDIFFLPGNVDSGASSATNGVINSTPITCESIDGYVTVASRYNPVRNDPLDYDWQIEKGSVPTTYEPYTSTTHTTTYPSAIYRGSEDVVNGEVTTEWKKVVFDGTENWQQASVDRPTCFILDGNLGFASIWGQTLDNGFSNYLVADNESAYAGRGPSFAYVNNRLYVGFPSASSLSDFTNYLSNNNLEICGLLTTPTTETITQTNLPIKSLSGYTHIESSTGDMEVEYITEEFQPIVDLIESAVELPEVSDLDDGKVLTVVNGKWVAASLPVGQNIQY